MVTVKALRPDDWETTRDLRLAALLDAPEAFGGTYEDSAKRGEEGWRQWPSPGQPFAAWIDDEPIGMACAYPSPTIEQVTLLIGMWVAPKARGTGVAPELIDAVVEWASQRGSEAVELEVYESNPGARRAYEKYGFADAGPSLEWEGATLMRLALS